MTEESAGSDATALKTRAERLANGDYLINGAKRYITLAPIAGLFTVLARSDDGPGAPPASRPFSSSVAPPGLSTSAPTPKMGQEGRPDRRGLSHGLPRWPRQHHRSDPGQGFSTLMKCLNKQRLNLAALSTGPAIRLLDDGIAYARERRQSGRAIAEFQLVQAMLAECKVEIEATRALILETARKRDRGEDVTMDVSLCKYLATEMCCRVADRIVQVFGGQGYVKGRGIERFYRDVRAARIYEGTSQIHLSTLPSICCANGPERARPASRADLRTLKARAKVLTSSPLRPAWGSARGRKGIKQPSDALASGSPGKKPCPS